MNVLHAGNLLSTRTSLGDSIYKLPRCCTDQNQEWHLQSSRPLARDDGTGVRKLDACLCMSTCPIDDRASAKSPNGKVVPTGQLM
jgi:hypothetical protein